METGPERKSVRVTIFNQPYTLAVKDDAGEVEALAHSVDDLMTEIAQHVTSVDTTQIAVLACLHLADRLRGIESELAGLRTRVGAKTREFSLLLDQVDAEAAR
jgi:cell division protein ZapA